jgi:hypothetical protein
MLCSQRFPDFVSDVMSHATPANPASDCRNRLTGGVVRFLVLATVLSAALPLWGSARTSTAATRKERVLEVFVLEGCPHCTAAIRFLSQLARERPELRIVYRSLNSDVTARDDLARLSQNAGYWPPGVPTFHMEGRILVGFDDAAQSGPGVISFIDQAATAADQVETRFFGALSASRLGLPLFTLALGLLDGFNPCAMWVLLFLLSLLVRLQDRKKMALIAGTFVLVSGAIYYAFMAAWLNVFLAVGMSDPLRWTLGAAALAIGGINAKDFFSRGRGFSLSIPDSAKPGLYARARAVLRSEALPASLAAVAALAVVVNFIELLCTAGFPAIYTAVLTQHDLRPAAHYAYLGLYIVGYIADDSLMVSIAVAALSSRKLTERAGRWLKLVSGAVMLALGSVMILRPHWLM